MNAKTKKQMAWIDQMAIKWHIDLNLEKEEVLKRVDQLRSEYKRNTETMPYSKLFQKRYEELKKIFTYLTAEYFVVVVSEYPIQDDIWPSRRWNKDRTEYIDLSGEDAAAAPSNKEVLNITKGEWKLVINVMGDFKVISKEDTEFSICEVPNKWRKPEINEANAKAIVTAVNETYGRGYDPAGMDEVVKGLQWAYDKLAIFVADPDNDSIMIRLKTALNNAKTIKP